MIDKKNNFIKYIEKKIYIFEIGFSLRKYNYYRNNLNFK